MSSLAPSCTLAVDREKSSCETGCSSGSVAAAKARAKVRASFCSCSKSESKSAHRRGVVSGISGARAVARDIGSVGNGNALDLLVFIIAEVVGNSSIE